jgi:hypothetical protein
MDAITLSPDIRVTQQKRAREQQNIHPADMSIPGIQIMNRGETAQWQAIIFPGG